MRLKRFSFAIDAKGKQSVPLLLIWTRSHFELVTQTETVRSPLAPHPHDFTRLSSLNQGKLQNHRQHTAGKFARECANGTTPASCALVVLIGGTIIMEDAVVTVQSSASPGR